MRRLAGAVALIAACSVGPPYHTPPAPTPRAGGYREAARTGPWRVASPADAMLRGAWWKILRQPELDALEARLEIDNQTIAQAFESFLAARAQIRVARAPYLPTVSAAPSVTVGRSPGGVGTGVTTPAATSPGPSASPSGSVASSGGGVARTYVAPLEASWAPDLFGRVRAGVRQAEANAQVSAADLENQRLIEQATLARTYFELRGQDALQQLLDQTVRANEQILAVARSRFTTGIDTEVAAVQAEQTLQAARVQATNAGILRAQYEHAIATLIGVPATDFALPRRPLLATPPAIPIGLPSRLLERRPDIAAAERSMAAANAAIGIGYASYFPDITLSGRAGFAGTALATLLSWPSRVWSIGAAVSETIFDGGLRRAQLDQYVAQYHATVAAYRQAVLTAFQQVEDGLSQTGILAQQIEQQRTDVQLAERALLLETARYQSGIDPYIDLEQQQTVLLSTRQALVTLQVQQMTSVIALIEALGGGWDRSDLPAQAQVSRRPGARERERLR